jgi:PAS domain-containing protein
MPEAVLPSEASEAGMLRAMLDAVPDILLYCQIDEQAAEMVILAVNATAEAVLGRSAASLIGTRPRELLSPHARPSEALRRELLRVGKERGVVEYPTPVQFPEDPDSDLEMRVRLVVLAEGRALMQIEVRPKQTPPPG